MVYVLYVNRIVFYLIGIVLLRIIYIMGRHIRCILRVCIIGIIRGIFWSRCPGCWIDCPIVVLDNR